MPRSTYYHLLKNVDKVADKNKELSEKIREIYVAHKGRYGVRRIHKELLNQGYKVNHKRVQRLMKVMNLAGIRPRKKYNSYKGVAGKAAANILERNFKTDAPTKKWTTDITQFALPWGRCFLSPILDMYTNEIIAYDLSMTPNLDQIKRMLNLAFSRFSNLDGLVFHSDQGWQYRHEFFQDALKSRNIIQSMSRKGNCYDNAIMETFFARMKNEMFYGQEHKYSSFKKFAKAVEAYINYYNNERIQAKTQWMPPTKFRHFCDEFISI